MKSRPILIIGMTRSGTTLVSRLLGLVPQFHLEIEPHMLWKAGNFRYLADNRFDIQPETVSWIRRKLLRATGEQVLVEKSPVNCIRPSLVHAVFPEARVIYTERDPIRCIYSNYLKTMLNESLKPSVVLKKYLRSANSHNGTNSFDISSFNHELRAKGSRKLYEQLRLQDVHQFLTYLLRLLYIRNVMHILPFGPKIENFHTIVKTEGALVYHAKVLKEAQSCKIAFQEFYDKNLHVFRLEDLHRNGNELVRLYDTCQYDMKKENIKRIMRQFNHRIIDNSNKPSRYDEIINQVINNI